ncbi:MAG: DUF4097 family beta strand repeat protein [Gemmatimonadaceae bacterium]|nr:DUF4097 family beta strand repeat protein [Gemmatimonadaceae bacterium]
MMPHRAFQWCAAAMALAAIPLGSQSSPGTSPNASAGSVVHAGMGDVTDTVFNVARNGVIDITVRSGRLVVRGSDRSTAELRANGSDYQVRSSGVSVTLAVAESNGRRFGARALSGRDSDEPDIGLLVPRGVHLVINGRSADVSVTDVVGGVEVHLQSGDVALDSLGGRVIVETISGDVSVNGNISDLRVTTVGGDVVARGIRGNAEVHTTSGEVSLAVERAEQVVVDAVSGDIEFDGSLSDRARLQFTTHSGDVMLRLPESAGGQLDVSTYNGDVSGGAMTLMPSSDSRVRGARDDHATRHYEFGGGGSARINVSTYSGDVVVRRGARRRIE